MRYAIVILVALMAGCGGRSVVWTKPDAAPNELDRDRAECLAQGGQASRYPKVQRHVYALCMSGRGWVEAK